MGKEKNKKSVEVEIFGQSIIPPDEAESSHETSDDIVDLGSDHDIDARKEALSAAQSSIKNLNNLNDASPELSSDDIDASWEDEQGTGEEMSNASVETPDQDEVDEVAEPWGLVEKRIKPLNLDKKKRDLERGRNEREEDQLSKR